MSAARNALGHSLLCSLYVVCVACCVACMLHV